MISQRYAIFDMDGTLVDSMPYWRNIIAEYLKHPISAEFAATISDLNVSEAIALTVKTYKPEKTPEQAYDEICDVMEEHYINHVIPKKGVISYLKKLQRNNVRMCVASASPQRLIQAALSNFEMLDFFEFQCSTEDGFADKRNPDIYMYCAEKFNSLPCETAVFEDSYSAILTAKKANFKVIGIYDESQKNYWQDILRTADICKMEYL